MKLLEIAILKPGSGPAIHRGCVCPTFENLDRNDGEFVYDNDCPLHGVRIESIPSTPLRCPKCRTDLFAEASGMYCPTCSPKHTTRVANVPVLPPPRLCPVCSKPIPKPPNGRWPKKHNTCRTEAELRNLERTRMFNERNRQERLRHIAWQANMKNKFPGRRGPPSAA